MLIQINTDDNIAGDLAMAARIEARISDALGRFADEVTRVEAHLSDESATRSSGDDKRCVLEARPAGRKPLSADHSAATVEEACSGAARKMQRKLQEELDRRRDVKGAASIRDAGSF